MIASLGTDLLLWSGGRLSMGQPITGGGLTISSTCVVHLLLCTDYISE